MIDLSAVMAQPAARLLSATAALAQLHPIILLSVAVLTVGALRPIML
jgi:hypothetical protein